MGSMRRKSNSEIKALFREVFNGKTNFMTPDQIGFGAIKDILFWELSKGEFMGRDLFGLTFIDQNPPHKNRSDISRSFGSRSEALSHLAKVKKVFKDD